MTNNLETQVTTSAVYTTGNYYIDVGPYYRNEDKTNITNCYRIINKITGVIEYMEMSLPQAILAADAQEKALTEILFSKKSNQVPVIN